ncbi:MAG: transglutaminase family protein, partial [Acetobacteraceae bacterium]
MRDTRLALEAIGRLPDAEIDIADAALQLARIDRPTADWASASAHLSDLARQAVATATVLPDGSPVSRARALSDLLVDRFGYRGDVETYDDLANANIISVIERRRGLPVALGVIWLHAAHAAGWTAYGIDFPAHFLIGLAHEGSQVVLDV